jgi:putative DNA primase/helicase
LWAIEGWCRLRKRGHFVQPPTGTELCKQMEDIASPVGEFIRERCEIGPGLWIASDSLFKAWELWRAERHYKQINDAAFGRDLRAAVPKVVRGQKRRDDGTQYYVYNGLALSISASTSEF